MSHAAIEVWLLERQFGEQTGQVAPREGPLEWSGQRLIVTLKRQEPGLHVGTTTGRAPARGVGFRTASVQTHARSRRGRLPYGGLVLIPATIPSVYGPLRRMNSFRLPGLVRGNEHSASSRAMKPRSASASLAPTSWSIWSRRVKWCSDWGAAGVRA